MASWGGSVGLHGALAVGAALFLLVRPPPPAPVPVDAIIVEIVIEEPPPVVEEAGLEGAGAEQAPETPETAAPAPAPPAPQHLQVVVPNRALPEVLALQGPMSWEVEPSVQILLPSNIRTALATAYYCRSTALGIRAEQQPCPPVLDQFALNARIAAMDPTMYYDAELIAAAQRLGLAGAQAIPVATPRGPVGGRDGRLSSADEMRDRLPPKHPAPFFGD